MRLQSVFQFAPRTPYLRHVLNSADRGPPSEEKDAMTTDNGAAPDGLEQGALSTAAIVFLVLAAVTPMAAVVGVVPLGVLLGDGAGFPGAYVIAGAVLLLFAVGYAAMSHEVTNAGAFYAYVARGIGRPAGAAAAGVAVIAYNAIMISVVGGFGYFAHAIIADELGITLPWEAWVAILLAVVAVLGNRHVDISAKVLGVALVCEMLILLILDVAILADRGLSAFSLHSFAPSTVFSGAPGVALLYAFYTFIGFEATALFGEEARDAKRSIPRATFIAVAVIAVFYTLTSWALVAGYGSSGVAAAAAKDPGNFVFAASSRFVGAASTHAMHLLIVTSLFAAVLALHNATSRYLFALGREGLLARALGRTHPRHRSPYIASRAQIAIAAVVVAGFAIGGADPYLLLGTSMGGLGTLGIVALQAAAAAAVIGYFRRRRDPRIWTTVIAPFAGAAGLVTACVLIVHNYSALTGRHSGIVNQLPWLLLAAAVAGVAYAVWLRSARPEVYAAIGEGEAPPASTPLPAEPAAVRVAA
jgi:amino acid transporter